MSSIATTGWSCALQQAALPAAVPAYAATVSATSLVSMKLLMGARQKIRLRNQNGIRGARLFLTPVSHRNDIKCPTGTEESTFSTEKSTFL